ARSSEALRHGQSLAKHGGALADAYRAGDGRIAAVERGDGETHLVRPVGLEPMTRAHLAGRIPVAELPPPDRDPDPARVIREVVQTHLVGDGGMRRAEAEVGNRGRSSPWSAHAFAQHRALTAWSSRR